MITPVRRRDGVPDVTRLSRWVATCDLCQRSAQLRRTERWFISPRPPGREYCPRCYRVVARVLIGQAFPHHPPAPRWRQVAADLLWFLPTRW